MWRTSTSCPWAARSGLLVSQLSENSIVQNLMSSITKEGGSCTIVGSSAVGDGTCGSTARRRSRKASSISTRDCALLREISDASSPIGEATAEADCQDVLAVPPQLASTPSSGQPTEPSQGAVTSFAPRALRFRWLLVQSLTLKVDYNVCACLRCKRASCAPQSLA